MLLDMTRRARLQITEDFVREAMTPDIMGTLFSEVFVYLAYHDAILSAYIYEATSQHFDKVADWATGKQLPVWEPELLKLPGLALTTRYGVFWRRVKDPYAKPLEREQTPTWKEDYNQGRNKTK